MEDFEQTFNTLREAVEKLYDAGHWTCDRDVDERALWENVRDAARIQPGNSPKPNQ